MGQALAYVELLPPLQAAEDQRQFNLLQASNAWLKDAKGWRKKYLKALEESARLASVVRERELSPEERARVHDTNWSLLSMVMSEGPNVRRAHRPEDTIGTHELAEDFGVGIDAG